MNFQAMMIYQAAETSGMENATATFEARELPIFASDAAKLLLPLFDVEPEFYEFSSSTTVGVNGRCYVGIERETREPIVLVVMPN